jgi:cytochrome oxidase Cu insertion factor (SCO1/SenC/PrrC family)
LSAASIPLDPRIRGRRTLLGIAALFFVPVAIAFALYYGSAWRPGHRTNHGELIAPARPLPEVALPRADGAAADARLFHGKWTLVYLGDGTCDPNCREALYTLRQTRLALANEMGRVQRVFLATSGCCDAQFLSREHPGLVTLDASGEAAAPLLARFPADGRDRGIFVVDPLGNLMLRFDLRQNPKGLLQDLKKLLALSQIG